MLSKNKRSTYPEDDPEHFKPHVARFIKRGSLPVDDFESFRNAFKDYMAGSNLPSNRITDAGALKVYKLLRDDIIENIKSTRSYNTSLAAELYDANIRKIESPGRVTKFDDLLISDRLIIGTSGGKRVPVYLSEYTRNGKPVRAYRTKGGRFAKVESIVPYFDK